MGRVAGKHGSTRQLAPGAWQAYFPAWVDPMRRAVCPGVTYSSEAKALVALEDALGDRHSGRIVFESLDEPVAAGPEPALTISVMFDRFLDEATDLSPGTRDQYRSVNRSVISHPPAGFGHLPAETVTTAELREWKLGLNRRGVT